MAEVPNTCYDARTAADSPERRGELGSCLQQVAISVEYYVASGQTLAAPSAKKLNYALITPPNVATETFAQSSKSLSVLQVCLICEADAQMSHNQYKG